MAKIITHPSLFHYSEIEQLGDLERLATNENLLIESIHDASIGNNVKNGFVASK